MTDGIASCLEVAFKNSAADCSASDFDQDDMIQPDAIKTVFQDKNPVSTLIFDEIDTGISGETAQKVSKHLKKLSKYKQVICITHLPQIAISADNHLHVTKSVINSNSTSVKAEYLTGDFSRNVIKNLFMGEEVET